MISEIDVDRLRVLAAGMADAAPMSAYVLVRLVDELEDESPISTIVGDHPEAGAPLFCVRVLAGVRYLVLTGKAPVLETHLRGLLSRSRDSMWMERTWELFR